MDEVWGGVITACTFDPVAWALEFGVEVLDGARRRSYVLTLDGVSRLVASREIPLPWTYAELTEVHVVYEPSPDLNVTLVLWSEDATMTVRCSDVRVSEASELA